MVAMSVFGIFWSKQTFSSITFSVNVVKEGVGYMRFSGFKIISEALRGHKGWNATWRDATPKSEYDYIIIGGGGHGLATA